MTDETDAKEWEEEDEASEHDCKDEACISK